MTHSGFAEHETRALAREMAERRTRTAARIVQLTRDLEALVEATHDSPDDEHDPEGATIGFERAQAGALLADARAQLADLDRAAAALATGRLGVCEACGHPIGTDRLLARPTSRVCVTCAV